VGHKRQNIDKLKAAIASARVAPLPDFPLPAAMKEELLTVGGGAAAGVLSVKMPKIPGTQLDSDVAIGTACVLLALMDVADGYDAELNAFGSGLLAAAAARETATHLLASQEKK